MLHMFDYMSMLFYLVACINVCHMCVRVVHHLLCLENVCSSASCFYMFSYNKCCLYVSRFVYMQMCGSNGLYVYLFSLCLVFEKHNV